MGILDIFLQSFSSASLLGVLVVLLFAYLISSSSFSHNDGYKEPPGPKPLPILGNLLQLDLRKPQKTFLELSKRYGSVYTFHLGLKKVVVLTGYKTVKEALVDHADEFGDRDPLPIMHEFNKGLGITWSNGDLWKEIRRFALTNLRDFGMGKKACEDKIIEECHHLLEVLKNFKGEAFETSKPLSYAISNIICSMIYGSRFEYDDPVFTSLLDRTRRRLQIVNTLPVQVYNLFPWFCKWIAGRKEIHRLGAALREQNIELCGRLKETLNPQMCRGFVDAFLVRKQSLEDSGITNSYFDDENLLKTVMNLFAAGTDTTANTMKWGLLFMATYPKIQDQIREELSRVIGSRQVQVEDRRNLPFTNAVIHEIQRLANIAPLGLPHKTTQDIIFQGHFIKKGTTVYPILTSVLFDESEWENPHTFNPSRFLDKDGKFVKRDAFMPFSAGRRTCPGESLAKMELFIFLCTLLQHFRFTFQDRGSDNDLDLTPSVGFLHHPVPHKLCAVPCV